jgi:hypothetical protein
MKIKNIALATIVGLSFSGAAAAAGVEEPEILLTSPIPVETAVVAYTMPTVWVPEAKALGTKRPAALLPLYASLGAMQVWDARSTSSALKAGAAEANPTAAPFAGNTASMLGLKAATTVGTIFFAERIWKKNPVGAVVLVAIINGATAAVAMNNMHNSRVASAR